MSRYAGADRERGSWQQNTVDVVEVAKAGDSFGRALAAGDLKDDGRNDLAVSVSWETTGSVAGEATNVILGSGSGLVSTGNQLWSQDSTKILNQVGAGDRFGESSEAQPR